MVAFFPDGNLVVSGIYKPENCCSSRTNFIASVAFPLMALESSTPRDVKPGNCDLSKNTTTRPDQLLAATIRVTIYAARNSMSAHFI